MRRIHTALGLSSLLVLAGTALTVPTMASAQPADHYVACNRYGDCWHVHRVYAYGPDTPIIYHDADWYDSHRDDEHVRWLSDPDDHPGYYDREEHWHADPGARAVEGGAVGAGLGAAIGCIVTIPVGCAPGAAIGAAVGGGTGAVGGAATTPEGHD